MNRDRIQELSDTVAAFGLKVRRQLPVEDSHSSTVSLLELEGKDRVILKIPYSPLKFRREKKALQDLEHSVPVPSVLGSLPPGENFNGALLLSVIPGRPTPTTAPISPALAYDAGKALAGIHSFEWEQFGDAPHHAEATGKGDWWELLDGNVQDRRGLIEQGVEPDLLRRFLRRYEELHRDLPAPDGPRLVHFDYRPGNLLSLEGRLTGVIDFESARGGSADLDFFKIQSQVWIPFPETKGPFLEGYAAVRPLPPFEVSLPFYQFYNGLLGLAWCAQRNRLRDPFFELNLQYLMNAME